MRNPKFAKMLSEAQFSVAMWKFYTDFQNDYVAERWHLRNEVGSGNFGKVYSVADRSGRNNFAVMKLACPLNGHKGSIQAATSALLEEGRMISFLNLRAPSLNIPTVLDHGYHKGLPYFVMNKFGKSVSQLWKEANYKLKPCTILRITYHVLKILEDLHSTGVAHGDIHGGNIVSGGAGQEKSTLFLIDFGQSSPLTPKNQREDVENILELMTRMLSYGKTCSLTQMPHRVARWVEDKYGMRSTERYCLAHELAKLVNHFSESECPNYERMMALLANAIEIVDEKCENGFDWDQLQQ
ncbi:Protein kinase domain containing protein [Gracilaria domingensis]|nr:Protein kinase domain containing protein [Gracilaria domingensis]